MGFSLPSDEPELGEEGAREVRFRVEAVSEIAAEHKESVPDSRHRDSDDHGLRPPRREGRTRIANEAGEVVVLENTEAQPTVRSRLRVDRLDGGANDGHVPVERGPR